MVACIKAALATKINRACNYYTIASLRYTYIYTKCYAPRISAIHIYIQIFTNFINKFAIYYFAHIQQQ